MSAARPPLIELRPRCRALRLAEVELGRLVLLDAPAAAGLLAIRADALSGQAELSEGVLRLDPAQPRFEPRRLDDPLLALELEYLIEPDLASARVRPPRAGDLLLSRAHTAAGLWLRAPWGGALFELASATLRPFSAEATGMPRLALHWRLLERGTGRVLFTHGAPHPGAEPPSAAAREVED